MAEAQLQEKDDVKATLLRTDEAFRQLVTEHQALDDKIRDLSTAAHLTDQQQFEEISLKKQKLALKDRIEAMMRQQFPISPPTLSH
jgi:uncharacterized protein